MLNVLGRSDRRLPSPAADCTGFEAPGPAASPLARIEPFNDAEKAKSPPSSPVPRITSASAIRVHAVLCDEIQAPSAWRLDIKYRSASATSGEPGSCRARA